jgi:electron transport complex protein RnfG
MKNGYLGQAWLVLALGLAFGTALAGVQITLSGKITQNKVNDTIGQIPSLVPGARRGEPVPIGNETVYRALDENGRQIGWVIPARGQGFADVLSLLVGLDSKAKTITGLYVLEQKETPGLGNRIENPKWRSQFAGLDASRAVAATKNAPSAGRNEIKAVSGATVSSESVCAIVNEAVARMRGELVARVKSD